MSRCMGCGRDLSIVETNGHEADCPITAISVELAEIGQILNSIKKEVEE